MMHIIILFIVCHDLCILHYHSFHRVSSLVYPTLSMNWEVMVFMEVTVGYPPMIHKKSTLITFYLLH